MIANEIRLQQLVERVLALAEAGREPAIERHQLGQAIAIAGLAIVREELGDALMTAWLAELATTALMQDLSTKG
jgi:hypothetical protein